MTVNVDFSILWQTAAYLNPMCEEGVCPFESLSAPQLSWCYVRYGILTAVLLRIQAYWDVTLRRWANGYNSWNDCGAFIFKIIILRKFNPSRLNIENHSPYNTALHSKRCKYSSWCWLPLKKHLYTSVNVQVQTVAASQTVSQPVNQSVNQHRVCIAKLELSRTVSTTDTSFRSFWMTLLHCSMFVPRHHHQLGMNPVCLFELLRCTTCINYLLLYKGYM